MYLLLFIPSVLQRQLESLSMDLSLLLSECVFPHNVQMCLVETPLFSNGCFIEKHSIIAHYLP